MEKFIKASKNEISLLNDKKCTAESAVLKFKKYYYLLCKMSPKRNIGKDSMQEEEDEYVNTLHLVFRE